MKKKRSQFVKDTTWLALVVGKYEHRVNEYRRGIEKLCLLEDTYKGRSWRQFVFRDCIGKNPWFKKEQTEDNILKVVKRKFGKKSRGCFDRAHAILRKSAKVGVLSWPEYYKLEEEDCSPCSDDEVLDYDSFTKDEEGDFTVARAQMFGRMLGLGSKEENHEVVKEAVVEAAEKAVDKTLEHNQVGETMNSFTTMCAAITAFIGWLKQGLATLVSKVTGVVMPFILAPIGLYMCWSRLIKPKLANMSSDLGTTGTITRFITYFLDIFMSMVPMAGCLMAFSKSGPVREAVVRTIGAIFGCEAKDMVEEIKNPRMDVDSSWSEEDAAKLREITQQSMEAYSDMPIGQGQVEVDENANIFCNLCAIFTGFMMYNNLPGDDVFVKGVRTVVGVLRMELCFRKMYQMIEWFFKKAPDCVKAWTYYIFGTYPGCVTEKPVVSRWLARVLYLREWNGLHPYDLPENTKLQQFVVDVFYEGIFLRSYMASPRPSAQEMRVIAENCKYLQGLYDQVLAIQGKAPVRQVPVGVFIWGKSQIGKTAVTTKLCADLFPNHKHPSYEKASRDKEGNWDGYEHQPVLILDDFATVSEDPMPQVLLNLIGNANMVLPMASLDNPAIGVKGTLFTSKVILASSNCSPDKMFTGIEDMSALRNRFHIAVQAKVVKYDVDGIVPDYQEDMSHLRFDLQSPYNANKVIRADLTYAELLKLIQIQMMENYSVFIKQVNRKEYPEVKTGFATWLTHKQTQYIAQDTLLTDLLSLKEASFKGMNYLFSGEETERVMANTPLICVAQSAGRISSNEIHTKVIKAMQDAKEYELLERRFRTPTSLNMGHLTFASAWPDCDDIIGDVRMAKSVGIDAEMYDIFKKDKDELHKIARAKLGVDIKPDILLAERDRPLTKTNVGAQYLINYFEGKQAREMSVVVSQAGKTDEFAAAWDRWLASYSYDESCVGLFDPQISGLVTVMCAVRIILGTRFDSPERDRLAEWYGKTKRGEMSSIPFCMLNDVKDKVTAVLSTFRKLNEDTEDKRHGLTQIIKHYSHVLGLDILREKFYATMKPEEIELIFGCLVLNGEGEPMWTGIDDIDEQDITSLADIANAEAGRTKNYRMTGPIINSRMAHQSLQDESCYVQKCKNRLKLLDSFKPEHTEEEHFTGASKENWPEISQDAIAKDPALQPPDEAKMLAHINKTKEELQYEQLDHYVHFGERGYVMTIARLVAIKLKLCFLKVQEVWLSYLPRWLRNLIKFLAGIATCAAAIFGIKALWTWYNKPSDPEPLLVAEGGVALDSNDQPNTEEAAELGEPVVVEAQSARGLWRAQMIRLLSMMGKDINESIPYMSDEQLTELVAARAQTLKISDVSKQDVQNLLDLVPMVKVNDRDTLLIVLARSFESMSDEDFGLLSDDLSVNYSLLETYNTPQLIAVRDKLFRELTTNSELKASYSGLLEKELAKGFRTRNLDVIHEIATGVRNVGIGDEDYRVEAQLGATEYSKKNRHYIKRKYQARGQEPPSRALAQVGPKTTGEMFDKLIKVIHDASQVEVNAIPLKGNAFLLPKHFWLSSGIKPDDVLKIKYKGITMCERFDPTRAKDVTNSSGQHNDACVYLCGPNVCGFKGLLKNFIQDGDLLQKGMTRAELITNNKGKDHQIDVGIAALKGNLKDMYYENLGVAVTLGKRYNYKGEQMQDGFCGGMLVTKRDSDRPILGMHINSIIGPRETVGCSTVVTQDQLAEVVDQLEKTKKEWIAPMIEPTDKESAYVHILKPVSKPHALDGNIKVYGQVPKRWSNRFGRKSHLTPSPCFRNPQFRLSCENRFAPAVLEPTDPRVDRQICEAAGNVYGAEPVQNAARNGGKKHKYGFKPSLAPLVDDYCARRTMKHDTGVEARLHTLDECINGIEGQRFVNGLDMSTSEGYPWSLRRPRGVLGKRWLFECEKPNAEPTPELLSAVNRRLINAKKGERTETIWCDFAKDECRELGKIAMGKTRKITCPPVDYNLVCKMYFGAFTDHFYRLSTFGEYSAVGINPYSAVWHLRYNQQASISPVGKDGDYGTYEYDIAPEECFGFLNCANQWYRQGPTWKEEDDKVRSILMQEMNHRVTLNKDIFYYTPGGEGSGNTLTVLLNTYINLRRHVFAWREIIPRPFNNFTTFEQNVDPWFYGDDDRTAITKAYEGWFNAKTFSDYMAKHNVKYTPCDKQSECSANLKDLMQLDFLKSHSGVLDTSMGPFIVPLFDKKAMNKTLNWVSDSIPALEAMASNMNSVLLKLSMYGENEFNYERNIWQKELDRIWPESQSPTLISYTECIDLFLNGGLPVFMDDLTDYAEETDEWNGPRVTAREMLRGQRFYRVPTQGVGKLYDYRDFKTLSDKDLDDFMDKLDIARAQSGSSEAPEVEQITGAVGTKFAGETEASPPSGIMTDDSRTLASSTLKEAPYSVTDMVMREQPVDQFEWETSHGVGHVYACYNLPWDLLKFENTKTPFRNMVYWRGKVKLRFKFNATRFHSGRLIVCWAPLCPKQYSEGELTTNRCTQTILRNTFIDPKVVDNVEIEIPFTHPRDWLDYDRSYDFGESLGTLSIMVFNELRVGVTEVSSVPVTVFVSFPDSEFKVPRNVSAINDIRAAAQGQRISKVINIDNAYESTIGMSKDSFDDSVKASAEGHYNGSNMDKPNVGINPVTIRPKMLPMLAHSNNVEYNERMNLHPGHMEQVTTQQIGLMEDEMNMKYLLRKECYCGSFQWSTASVHGAYLSGGLISPTECIDSLGLGDTINIPLLDYVSSKFQLWTGSIEFLFEGVMSQIHTGKLVFCVHYGLQAPPRTMEDAMTQYYLEFSLDDLSYRKEVIIPYRAAVPQKRVGLGMHKDTTEYSIGCWSMWVLNPLRAVNACSNVIDINLYKRAGQDFQLSYFGLTGLSVTPASCQVGATSISVDKSSAIGVNSNYDEPYTTVKDFARRFSMFKQGRITFEENTWKILDVQPVRELVNSKAGQSIVNHFGLLYRTWRGSLRVKYAYECKSGVDLQTIATWLPERIPLSKALAIMTRVLPLTSADSLQTMLPYSIANGDTPYHELEVPFVVPYNYLIKDMFQTETDSQYMENGTVVLFGRGSKAGKFDFSMWVAGGDNIHYNHIVRIPIIRTEKTNNFFDAFRSDATSARFRTVPTHLLVRNRSNITDEMRPEVFRIADSTEAEPVYEWTVQTVTPETLGDKHHTGFKCWIPKDFIVDVRTLAPARIRTLFGLGSSDNYTFSPGLGSITKHIVDAGRNNIYCGPGTIRIGAAKDATATALWSKEFYFDKLGCGLTYELIDYPDHVTEDGPFEITDDSGPARLLSDIKLHSKQPRWIEKYMKKVFALWVNMKDKTFIPTPEITLYSAYRVAMTVTTFEAGNVRAMKWDESQYLHCTKNAADRHNFTTGGLKISTLLT